MFMEAESSTCAHSEDRVGNRISAHEALKVKHARTRRDKQNKRGAPKKVTSRETITKP